MNKFETKFFLFALIGWIATGAQAHTLLNGSFEAVDKSGHVVDWTYDPD